MKSASVIAVASGKGGVGKTNVAVNLSVALARLGHRVGLFDADFGLGNVDVLLGLTPEFHVGHLLAGEATLEQLMVSGPAGVQIVPASSGLRSLTALSPAQRAILADAFERLCSSFDFLFIDTASGISDNVVEAMLLAGRVAIVTSVEPAAIVDAYATVKVLTAAAPTTEIGIVVNNVRSGEDASLAYRQLDVAANRFLGRSLKFYGFIAEDRAVRDAVLVQRSIVDHLPQAEASRCFRILAARFAGMSPVDTPGPRAVLTARPSLHDAQVQQCA
jgi:flagellar biosynthesis protein FlhG